MDSIYSWSGSNYTQNYAAHVTLRGEGSCALGNYNHELNILGHAYGSGLTNIISHYGYSNSMDAAWPSLLAMSPVTATDVSITHRYVQWHYNSSNIIWAFTSLPFDVRLSDLVIEGKDLQYSIMKYSGQAEPVQSLIRNKVSVFIVNVMCDGPIKTLYNITLFH